MKIKAIRPYKGPVNENGYVPVYDLTVDYMHRYVVNGVVVSNSKRVSLLDVNALLAHGATETIADAGSVRGQQNPDYWMQFMNGFTPRDPKVPHVHEKFFSQLQGSGINIVRDGSHINIMALTDKDVDKLAGDRTITSGETVHFDKDMRPVPGGLFDPSLTGGHGGKQWSRIKLEQALPNPVMEEPVRRMLGLTQKGFEAVISGQQELPGYGSGGDAIHKALKAINVTREIGVARVQMKASRGQKRDDAIRKLDYLKRLQKMKMTPDEWVLNKVPVLPPAFRPVSVMGSSGMPLVSDANYLYKELLEANDIYKQMSGEVGHENAGNERLALYNSFKAVTGLGEPISTKSQEKKLKGLLSGIFGSSPKYGTVQRKLISSTVDNVGRAVITPNPDYDMDTVGIPETKAFDVYERAIVRRMRMQGMPMTQALRHVKDRTDLARDILSKEMENRPVFINRAPVLHKFGIMAFRPRLVKGDTMQVSPLIVKGFNADFDGDAMQFHVPTTDAAVKEAYDRLLPSKNLLSPADFKSPVHVPGQDYLGGLFEYTRKLKDNKKRSRTFRNKKDALAAYERGEITYDEPVHVIEDR